MASCSTSRTGFTAFRWWFPEAGKPQARWPKGTFSRTDPFDGDYGALSGFPSGGASFLWISRIFWPTFLILPAFFNRITSV